MFDRYNGSARRVIFFARWEAGQYGSQEITTEHLLLAMLWEAKSLMREFLSVERWQAIQEGIEERAPIAQGYISTRAELPLSPACIIGYINGQEWMCEKCYGIFVASKAGADHSDDLA